MAKIDDGHNAFVTKIQALYDIETQLEKALPKLQKAAKDKELKEGFASHLVETKNHKKRIENIFEMLEMKPKKLASDGIKGIIKDGSWVIKAKAPSNVKDAMLAGAARYAEHYEMAGYMSAIMEADILGYPNISALLSMTLEEEKVADEKLREAIRKNFT